MKLRRAFAPFALLAAAATAAIVAAQPGSGDRHRAVAGWLVEDVAQEDGGRLVRMARTSGPYRLEYHAAHWHGNSGIIQRASAMGAGCGSDDEIDRYLIVHVSELRRLLAAGLAQCGASRSAVRAALRGVDPAYALARAWSWEATAATAAEAAAIADQGAEDGNGSMDDPCRDALVNMAAENFEMNDVQGC